MFLPGEFHGQRSPAGCSPWGRKWLNNWAGTHATYCVFYLRCLFIVIPQLECELPRRKEFYCSCLEMNPQGLQECLACSRRSLNICSTGGSRSRWSALTVQPGENSASKHSVPGHYMPDTGPSSNNPMSPVALAAPFYRWEHGDACTWTQAGWL